MGRIKGFKLTDKQKETIAAGRMKKAKKFESEIKEPKRSKDEKLIAAYGFSKGDDHPIPIFTSEVSSYKGKMFRTLDRATEAFKKE